ncbi:MAG: aspartate kinase [Spirochaetales bacterium]
MFKVAKFGGSSVSSAIQFAKVKKIVSSDPSRHIVVISAAGKRSSDDHKLTDLLYLCHAHLTYGVSCNDIFKAICDRFIEIRDSLHLDYRIEDELENLRAKLNKDISVDYLVSRGEYLTSRLMAEYLGYFFLDASDCIFMNFDGSFDSEKIGSKIKAVLKDHPNIVIPGFYGSLPGGKIRVMSRGGSDITGSIAAVAAGADIYENWTDVSGILMADPRIVPNPKPIPRITYAELRELAFMGASVLHEEAVQPVKEAGIALNIRNTNVPEDEGTMIVPSIGGEELSGERFITGIAGRRNFDIITVRKHNMNVNQSLRQALEIFDTYKVNVEHITLGLDSFAVVASALQIGEGLYNICSELQKSLRASDVQIQEGIALVAAVGRKMSFRPGISGKLFRALGQEGVNIRTIAQGSDELSIILGVDNSQYESAVRVLYDSFAG